MKISRPEYLASHPEWGPIIKMIIDTHDPSEMDAKIKQILDRLKSVRFTSPSGKEYNYHAVKSAFWLLRYKG